MVAPQYREGTWFGIPLRGGGYAIGLVARQGRRGRLFGYFFGPVHESEPKRSAVDGLQPEDSIYLSRFGDLNLLNGEWPIIGQEPHWVRERWPLPAFARIDEQEGKAWLSYYSDDDLAFVREENCSLQRAANYPRDRLSGASALELHLTRILTGNKP